MTSALTYLRPLLAIVAATLLVSFATSPSNAADAPAATAATSKSMKLPPVLVGAKRVVILGDSITHAGRWVAYVETYLRTHVPNFNCEIIAVGLPSETVSGLSEEGHAGGAFPRPTVHERLERVLAATKPDVVVACYGMNCGIYHPLGEERFKKYQEGMELLRKRAADVGAKVVHLTPAVFDAEPIRERTLPAGQTDYRRPYVGYDDVLAHYSDWLVSKRTSADGTAGWDVVDVHGPMLKFLKDHRAADPKYRLAGDGVHPNDIGQWLIARPLLVHWGAPAEVAAADDGDKLLAASKNGKEILALIITRQNLLRDAWLTKTGHKRPGIKPGLPLEEAEAKAKELNAKIAELTK
jgi:lysophospholipase L1-like esterase